MHKIDVLDREEFVNQLVSLTDCISKAKGNTTFAIDGKWGCGKSFVLDMFEARLADIQCEETAADKYFTIRYNCWKYDYYEEPLVAIVASITEAIEEKTMLLDAEKQAKVKGLLKAVGATLFSLTSGAIKTSTGVDVKEAFDVVNSGLKAGNADYEKMHKYDVYFSFNKALKSLQDVLKELGEYYTIVIMIDELDRCMPEYAVRVLERLHHLTDDVRNIVSVIAVNKHNLELSLNSLFGIGNTSEYLKKIINFSLELDIGKPTEAVSEKYVDYFDLFDKEIFVFNDSVEEFIQLIFNGLEIREQEELVSKAKTVHEMLFVEKKDYSFMCMELLLTVLICVYNNDMWHHKNQRMFNFETVFDYPNASGRPHFVNTFKTKFESLRYIIRNRSDIILHEPPSLYGAILHTWYWMNEGWQGHRVVVMEKGPYNVVKENYKELRQFAELIKLIKK